MVTSNKVVVEQNNNTNKVLAKTLFSMQTLKRVRVEEKKKQPNADFDEDQIVFSFGKDLQKVLNSFPLIDV